MVRKAVITVVVLIVAWPFLKAFIQNVMPTPVTFDRVQQKFESIGFSVANVQDVGSPGLQAIAQRNMTVNAVPVSVYQYNDFGKLAKQLEYQKPDPGAKMVESWGLAQSLGAAPNPNTKSAAAKKGMFMIVVTTNDDELRSRLVEIFEGL